MSHNQNQQLLSMIAVAASLLLCTSWSLEAAPPNPGEAWTVPEIGIDLVWVPPGEFAMGSPVEERLVPNPQGEMVDPTHGGESLHSVRITRPFWIGKTEVTQSQYEKLTGRRAALGNTTPADTCPAPVRWQPADAYCRGLTIREQKAGRLPDGYVYRLPTEAEWEYACRAGTTTTYWWGNEFGEGHCNVHNNISGGHRNQYIYFSSRGLRAGGLQDVEALPPNPRGLHGMLGNAAEWCLDRAFSKKSPGPKTQTNAYTEGAVDPLGTLGMERVQRGGSYFRRPYAARCAARARTGGGVTAGTPGFRIVLGPDLATDQPVKERTWVSPQAGMPFVWVHALNCWVGQYEVTNQQYKLKESEHKSYAFGRKGIHTGAGFGTEKLDWPGQPVVYVTYEEAKSYARWLTEQDRASGALPEGHHYRLPTRNEWTVFAQCGDGRTYPWGNTFPPKSGKAGNYDDEVSRDLNRIPDGYRDGHGLSCDVVDCWENPWGLAGVGGNVCEATSDEPFGNMDAWRGGAWINCRPERLTCAYRDTENLTGRSPIDGFRLLLTVRAPVEQPEE